MTFAFRSVHFRCAEVLLCRHYSLLSSFACSLSASRALLYVYSDLLDARGFGIDSRYVQDFAPERCIQFWNPILSSFQPPGFLEYSLRNAGV